MIRFATCGADRAAPSITFNGGFCSVKTSFGYVQLKYQS